MKTKKILLLNPANFNESWGPLKAGGGINAPMGLLYLSAILKKNGYEVIFLDANIHNMRADEVADYIKQEKPDIVGITCVTATFNYAKEYCKVIKSVSDKILIVVGGPHITAANECIMESDYIDMGVYGEGEYTMLELVNNFNRSTGSIENIQNIKGLIFKNTGKCAVNPPRELIQNLDELPLPDYKMLGDIRKYRIQIDAYRRFPIGTMITSRGCPYQCIFCDRNTFGTRYREHSPERIFEEIKILYYELGCKEIKFLDDMFTLKKERMEKLCDMIINGDMDFTWSCSLRADFLFEDMLKKMKSSGLWMVNVGIESGNQEILKNIKKSLSLETVRKTVTIANKTGIKVRAFFILGHPGETKQTMRDTLDFAKSLPLYTAQFSLATPFLGTELYNIAEKYGTRDKNLNQYSEKFPVFIPKGLTKEKLLEMHRRCYKEFYVRPLQLLSYILMIRTWSDIKRYYLGFKILMAMVLEFFKFRKND